MSFIYDSALGRERLLGLGWERPVGRGHFILAGVPAGRTFDFENLYNSPYQLHLEFLKVFTCMMIAECRGPIIEKSVADNLIYHLRPTRFET